MLILSKRCLQESIVFIDYRQIVDCMVLFPQEQQDFLSVLEPLNIEGRYPEYRDRIFKSLSPTKCREIIDQTRQLKEWIFEKLKK